MGLEGEGGGIISVAGEIRHSVIAQLRSRARYGIDPLAIVNAEVASDRQGLITARDHTSAGESAKTGAGNHGGYRGPGPDLVVWRMAYWR